MRNFAISLKKDKKMTFLPIMSQGLSNYELTAKPLQQTIQRCDNLKNTNGLGVLYSENKDVTLSLSIESQWLYLDQSIKATEMLSNRFGMMYHSIGQMENIVNDVSTLLIDGRQPKTAFFNNYTNQIQSMLGSLTSILNTFCNGEYIFGSGAAQTPPAQDLTAFASLNASSSDPIYTNSSFAPGDVVTILLEDNAQISRNLVMANSPEISNLVKLLLMVKGIDFNDPTATKNIAAQEFCKNTVSQGIDLLKAKINDAVNNLRASGENAKTKKSHLSDLYDTQCRDDIVALTTIAETAKITLKTALDIAINNIRDTKDQLSMLRSL